MKFCVAAASPADDRAAQPIIVCPTPSGDRVEPEPIRARLCGSYPVTKVIQFWSDIFNSHGPCFHFQLRFRGNMLGAEIVSNELSLDPSSVCQFCTCSSAERKDAVGR